MLIIDNIMLKYYRNYLKIKAHIQDKYISHYLKGLSE